MRDIKSFAKDKKQPLSDTAAAGSNEEELKSKVDELSSKSESELLNELTDAVNAGKQDGSFSPEALSRFISNVSPMLSEEQRKRLDDISKRLS